MLPVGFPAALATAKPCSSSREARNASSTSSVAAVIRNGVLTEPNSTYEAEGLKPNGLFKKGSWGSGRHDHSTGTSLIHGPRAAPSMAPLRAAPAEGLFRRAPSLRGNTITGHFDARGPLCSPDIDGRGRGSATSSLHTGPELVPPQDSEKYLFKGVVLLYLHAHERSPRADPGALRQGVRRSAGALREPDGEVLVRSGGHAHRSSLESPHRGGPSGRSRRTGSCSRPPDTPRGRGRLRPAEPCRDRRAAWPSRRDSSPDSGARRCHLSGLTAGASGVSKSRRGAGRR